MKMLRLLFALLVLPLAAMAQDPVRIVVNLATKEVTATNTISIRERVPVLLVNIGAASPSNMVARITDNDGMVMAYSAAFTNSGTNALGVLDLNTAELVAFFTNASPQAARAVNFGVWETNQARLLVNAKVTLQNNIYQDGMAGPSPVGTDYLEGTWGADSNAWQAGYIVQTGPTAGQYFRRLPTNLVSTVTNLQWGKLVGNLEDQADLFYWLTNLNHLISVAESEISGVYTLAYTKAQADARFASTGDLATAQSALQTQITGISTLAYPKAQSDSKYATTDRVEQVAALVGGGTTSAYSKAESDTKYATTGELAVLSLRVDTATNNLATVIGWGNHATNGYVVQGGNITGKWFAVGNTKPDGFNDFIGGGAGNIITSIGGQPYKVIVGGFNNQNHSGAAFIGGGGSNTATNGNYQVVSGGQGNNSAGTWSSIGGGLDNTTTDRLGTIPGGYNNTAADFAFASGSGAKATNSGSFVWSGPGTTNATFGSRGDNTFNVRSVGGAFFLLPAMSMMDTNGNTWATLTPTGGLRVGINSGHIEPSGDFYQDSTNSALMGDVYAEGYKRRSDSNSVVWSGEAPTVAQYTALLSRVVYLESTLTQQVASLLAQLPIVSNAFVAADAVVTGLVAGVDTRLVLTSNYFATAKTAQDNTNAWLFTQVTNRDYIVTTSLQASVAANLSTFSTFTNGYAAAITSVNAVAFGGTVKSGFMLWADWEAVRTNVVFGFLDTVAATNSSGAQNYLKYDGNTNTWLHDGIKWRWWSRYGF